MAVRNGGRRNSEKAIQPEPKIDSQKENSVENTIVQDQPVQDQKKSEPRMRVSAVQAYGLTADRIQELIAAGEIANLGDTELTISAKVTKTKDETLVYEKLIALSFNGQLALAGEKEEIATVATEGVELTPEQEAKGACDHFNYGFDLEVKRILRGKLAELIEGPAKAIAKGAQNLIDNGFAETMEEAITMVKASRVKKGLPV